MIPDFPTFKKIELSDEKEVRLLVEKADLPPYADFCFVNMWIWDTGGDMLVSKLHDNLVVVFRDYASREAFLSFIGKNQLHKTAAALIEFSKKHYKIAQLKLIPEEVAKELSQGGFEITSDEGSHDYIYEVAHLADMDRWGGEKSKNINDFVKMHPHYQVKQVALQDLPIDDLKNLFERWGKNKNLESIFDLNEYRAFERLMQMKNEDIHTVLFYVDGILIGFTVYEFIGDHQYAISRFAKADISYNSSIYDVLNWEEAKILKQEGVKYYNWEQDLGISGLRYSKMKYEPIFLLKKFIVGA